MHHSDKSITFLSTEQLYQTQLQEHEKAKDQVASATELHMALQSQMESHRENHQRQLSDLRKAIDEKQDKIDEMTE